jgi:hypothetical protein
MDWETIKSEKYNKRFPRRPDDEIEYQLHKEITKEICGNIDDAVKSIYIDPFEPYILIKNRFGYNLSPWIKHYLLWVNPKYKITPFSANIVIRERFPGKDFCFFVNPVKHRSVLSIIHYHVFIKII